MIQKLFQYPLWVKTGVIFISRLHPNKTALFINLPDIFLKLIMESVLLSILPKYINK